MRRQRDGVPSTKFSYSGMLEMSKFVKIAKLISFQDQNTFLFYVWEKIKIKLIPPPKNTGYETLMFPTPLKFIGP
jgi:hypothetical protein